ncbi:MAG: GSCFA domain-containing protein [Alphaproteobacteria bacterium]
MTESWVDRDSGTVFPTAPGVLADRGTGSSDRPSQPWLCRNPVQPARHPRPAALLTPSDPDDCHPVTHSADRHRLGAPLSGRYILASTTASKATLRADIDEFTRDLLDIDYVPSDEISIQSTARGRSFPANLRSVTPEGIDLVMTRFRAAHGLALLPPGPAETRNRPYLRKGPRQDVPPMTPRNLIIRTSHTTALRLAWTGGQQDLPENALDFAALQGMVDDLTMQDGHLMAKSDDARDRLLATSGRTHFARNDDAFIAVCCGVSGAFSAFRLYQCGLPSLARGTTHLKPSKSLLSAV